MRLFYLNYLGAYGGVFFLKFTLDLELTLSCMLYIERVITIYRSQNAYKRSMQKVQHNGGCIEIL